MSEKGWIKLDRRILEHKLWKDKPFSKGQAWLDLLMLANYNQRNALIGNQVIELQEGQLLTTEKELMERWGWGNTKVRNFIDLLVSEKMLIKNQSTKQSKSRSLLTIVNWGLYQTQQSDEQSSKQSTNKVRTKYEQSTSKESKKERNEEYIEGDNINNNYIYTPLPPKIDQPIPEAAEPELEQIKEAWNAIPHTVNLRDIIPMTRRYDELRVVISMVGFEGVMRAIQSVKDSEWMKNKGHISFDSFIANRNNIQKTLEGSYDRDFETERKPKPKQNTFNNFEQREYDYAELEKKLFNS